MSHDTYAIETNGLTKRFGTRVVVDDVAVRVPRGTTFGLLGPNGAGKTTLMRLLLGLIPPSAGTIRMLGLPMPAERQRALGRVGAIVEEPRFHPHLSGRENLWVIAAARGGAASSNRTVALGESGLRPALMTASAPTRWACGNASVSPLPARGPGTADPGRADERARPRRHARVPRDGRQLAQEGRTVVISSHLLDEIERTCDHVAIIDEGRIVVQASIAQLEADSAPIARFTCDRPETAAQIVVRCDSVDRAITDRDGVRVMLKPGSDGPNVAAILNRQLVLEHVTIFGFELTQPSLEQRFLEITSRLGVAA